MKWMNKGIDNIMWQINTNYDSLLFLSGKYPKRIWFTL